MWWVENQVSFLLHLITLNIFDPLLLWKKSYDKLGTNKYWIFVFNSKESSERRYKMNFF